MVETKMGSKDRVEKGILASMLDPIEVDVGTAAVEEYLTEIINGATTMDTLVA